MVNVELVIKIQVQKITAGGNVTNKTIEVTGLDIPE